ncbi:MAG: flagellar biosynthesis protein FlhA [Candidatus Gastranaerophilales bacterium]|nr:flagellar biosynthesis protein FlhA [Candidatus Gastranaerophilales bacterium]
MKPSKTQYCIKSCPTDDTEQLQLLLNTMAAEGWDLYTMQEAEADDEDGYQFNCIFVKEVFPEDLTREDFSEYFGFKTKMERIMAPKREPLDICIDIQKKIKEQRAKIARIKSLLDSTSEDSRKQLNDEISVNINELDNLKKKLFDMLSPAVMYGKLGEDKMAVLLSEELTDLLNPDTEINLLTKIVQVRQNLTDELGFVIPEVRLKNGDCLEANEFVIEIRGTQAVKSACYPGYIMFFRNELNLPKLPKNSIKDTDPITNEKIVWIEEEKAKDFWAEGYDSNEYIARLLKFFSVKYADELVDYSAINKYIETVAMSNLFLIENIIPDFVSVGELKYLITNLIRERVSVKDIVYIFEKINDLVSEPGKEDLLVGLRRCLARKITASLTDKNGEINVVELSEKSINSLIGNKKDGNVVKIESSKIETIVKNLKSKIAEKELQIRDVVLVMPSEIRQIGFLVFSKFVPELRVAAREEITTDYPSKIVAVV